MTTTAAADGHGEEGPLLTLCPGCGYDLRGTGGDRCSECGLEIDRAALRESGYPWAHRRRIGRITAYLRTVWMVTIDSRRLAHEAARPQEGRDGRAFRALTAGVLAVTFLGAWVWVVGVQRGLEFLAFGSSNIGMGPPAGPPGWMLDVAVPWSAGATMPWVIPACLVLLAVYMTGVQQAVFRAGAQGESYRRRAGVIAHYAAGPLVLLMPALVCFVAVQGLDELRFRRAAAAFLVAGSVLTIVGVGATLLRVGQWVRRIRYGGAGVGVLAAGELAGLWLFGGLLLLGFVPWCVGFFWVVIDSYR